MKLIMHLVAAVWIASGAPAAAQSAVKAVPRFDVASAASNTLEGPRSIRVEGLPPHAEVVVRAERVVVSPFLGGARRRFRSEATFTSDARGTVDLATATPTTGSYRNAGLHGLFWSMAPSDDALTAADRPGSVVLLALVGQAVVAQTRIDFPPVSTLVDTEPAPPFPGAVFAKPKGATDRLPALILLGGAEGGSEAARLYAPRLAAQGFAVLGLPYFSPSAEPGGRRELPALPAEFINIDVRQLEAARAWLQQRADVNGQRIGLYGASGGAEFALLAASHMTWIRAVVAVAPSDVVWEGFGWSMEVGQSSSFALDGKPLPFVPYEGFVEEVTRVETGQPTHLRRPHDQGRRAHPDRVASARIPVERFRGALLLLAGEDDQLWDSAGMARNIAARRTEAGLATELLVYPDAGHNLNGDGWSPTTHYNLGPKQSGGTPEGTARAQINAGPRILAFLRKAL